MRKGQAGTIIILLIIIIVALIVLWPQIQNLIQTRDTIVPPEYKNDVVTIEKIYVLPSNPYAGSVVKIGFHVQSNAEFPIPSTVVNFFDLKGLEIEDLHCDDGESEIINIVADGVETPVGAKCTFDQDDDKEIDILDFKLIELTLITPPKESIPSETPMTISYYIEYDYYGYRAASIPIIDGLTVVEPSSSFDQSTVTYGPIVLDFKLPPVSEREEDGRIIKEYWVIEGAPFELKINLKHVGSSSLGIIEPVVIPAGYIEIKTTTTLIKDDEFLCEFNFDRTEEPYKIFKSNKDVEVPQDIVCNFRAELLVDEAETLASVYARYDYTYKYTRTETFTVRPIPE